MKRISLLKSVVLILGIILFQSCESDKIIEQIEASRTSGGVLRTVATISSTYDVADLSSAFSIEIEEQDSKDGALLSEIKVYVQQVGGGAEVLYNTIPASAFAAGPHGLPRTSIAVTLQQAIDALGITASAVDCGGIMSFRLALHLTDGRVFSDNASGNVSGGSFFKSPFRYNVAIVANLSSDTLYTGQYQLTTTDVGLFGVADYASGVYTIEAISNTERVLKQVSTFPAFGPFGPVDVKFNFVCGEIILVPGQSVGAGCSGTIRSGTADVNALYDINNPDDNDFTINFTSNEESDCGGGTVQASIRLVKI